MAKTCALDCCPEVAGRLRARTKTICLRRGEVIRLEKKSGVNNIETKDGAVWLTGTPANDDVLLKNGEQFELQNHWPYIIEALEQTDLLLLSNL